MLSVACTYKVFFVMIPVLTTNLVVRHSQVNGPLDGIIIIFAVVIGAPIVEEILFRGVLFEELKKETSFKMTIFFTALVFGIYHFNILQSPNTFFMGLVLGYVYYKTKLEIKKPPSGGF